MLISLLAVFLFEAPTTATAIFLGHEQDVGSPLRVAQCRATCLERVSYKPFAIFQSLVKQTFKMFDI